MPGFWNRKHDPIGVDFGSSGFKLMQGRWEGDVWRATAAASQLTPEELPQDDAERVKVLTERLAAALSAGSFHGREAISCLPSSMWQCKSLRLPPMPRTELQMAVEWEAADRLNLNSDYFIQYFDAGEVRQGEELRQEVIILAASHHDIDQHVKILTGCGLTPLAIDVAPSALALAIASRDSENAGNDIQFTLDIGAASSHVVISRQGRVLFLKSIGIGTRQMIDAIATKLKVSHEDAFQIRRKPNGSQDTVAGNSRDHAVADAVRSAVMDLAREVGLCLRYYSVTFRGHRPKALVVTGGGADTTTLIDILAQEVSVEVRSFDQLEQFDFSQLPDRTASTPASCWTVAAGLSMRADLQRDKRGAA